MSKCNQLTMDYCYAQYKRHRFLSYYYPFGKNYNGDIVAYSKLDDSVFIIKRTSEKCYRAMVQVGQKVIYLSGRTANSILEQLEFTIKKLYKELNYGTGYWR